jgi:hypothetical protein
MKPGRSARIAVFSALAAVLALLCGFFAWYTVRLVYINLAVPPVAKHRQSGMYIGAVAFPVATFVFGWLSLRCARAVRRRG